MGVMAPIHRIPVMANTYKLPENKKMPINSINADQFSHEDGMLIDKMPTSNKPSAW